MPQRPWQRPAALALLLTATALAAAGCDRRTSDPALPSTGSTTTTPSTLPSTPAPDAPATAASN